MASQIKPRPNLPKPAKNSVQGLPDGKKGLLRKTPLRRVSKKRAVENKIYLKLRNEYLITHPYCWFLVSGKTLPGVKCGMRATDVHHKAGRVGKALLEVGNFCAVCREHHRYLHDNPAEARKLGLIIYDFEKEAAQMEKDLEGSSSESVCHARTPLPENASGVENEASGESALVFTPQGWVDGIRFGGLSHCGKARPGIKIDLWDRKWHDGAWIGGVMTKEQAVQLRDFLNKLIPACSDLP